MACTPFHRPRPHPTRHLSSTCSASLQSGAPCMSCLTNCPVCPALYALPSRGMYPLFMPHPPDFPCFGPPPLPHALHSYISNSQVKFVLVLDELSPKDEALVQVWVCWGAWVPKGGQGLERGRAVGHW